MSHCPQCRHNNPADARFCLECGQRLARVSAACCTELPSEARFCKECGQAVEAEVRPRVGSPKSYTPKQLPENDELIFVVEGANADESGVVATGHMNYRPNGCVHTVTTLNGATVLAVVWGRTEPV